MSALIKSGELRSASGAEAGLRTAALTAASAYVSRCLRAQRPFTVLTGNSSALDTLPDRLAAEYKVREDLHLVQIDTPTDSIQEFLMQVLGQLGFELDAVALDDLHNLLVVFLRHEGARGRRTVFLIEHTQRCGPRVLEFLQILSRVRVAAVPAATFVMLGTPALGRILDSPGMACLKQFTRERFDLDCALVRIADTAFTVVRSAPVSLSGSQSPAIPVRRGSLVVMLDGAVLERRTLAIGRLLIGRSQHNDLCLQSRFVSRNHAVLIITETDVQVADLRSTNPTRVNGQAVQNQALTHGDLLSIGNYQLRFDTGL